jgi:hypothetical protein
VGHPPNPKDDLNFHSGCFFWGSFFVFLQEVLRKKGVWMWFFDGEFVVGLW